MDLLFECFSRDEFYENFQKKADLRWDDESEQYLILIEAPGFSKDDIKIEADNTGLSIKGEIKDEYLKKAFNKTELNYVFRKNDLDIETVKAEFKNGILNIKVKKIKNKTLKIIEIL
jgi:HSP20 family protein